MALDVDRILEAQKQDNFAKQIATLERQKEVMTTEVERLRRESAKAQKTLEKVQATARLALRTSLADQKSASPNLMPLDMTYLQTEIDRNKQIIREHQEKIDRYLEDIKYIEKGLQEDKSIEQARLNEKFAKQIRTARLTNSFEKLHSKLDIVFMEQEIMDRDIDQIEQVLDDSLLAVYVQEKMGQLLNSQVICTATRRRCQAPADEKIKIDSSVIQSELFPGAKYFRSEYYDKMSKRRLPTSK